MKVQRLRVTFRRGEELKYITHLDLMRTWERMLRRAGLPLAYSEGFTPHPQISFAAALPVGVIGEREVVDLFLSERVSPEAFLNAAAKEAPPGLELLSAEEVGLSLPSLQSEMRWAEYEVEAPADGWTPDRAREAIERFLAAESIPWEHQREKETKRYDIRAVVQDLRLLDSPPGRIRLWMRLRHDQEVAGRAEQVAAALGLPEPERIVRTRLILAETSPARERWRRTGQYVES
ncbi:MAG TPA: TIGR03936 family radical SAM-associated protein [Dehalococcoidia bacterium]|jgi:radical SAM-linked protein|nr:TIGR03936 family radical SAM-associated protein [Dehalococcoidia bacterium]